MRRQAHFHLHKGTQERLVWKMCVPSMRCVKKKRYKCVHNSQACFVPLRSRYIFTYNWQKFVTDKDKCLPRSICCTAYCHTYQVTKKLKTRTNTLNNFTRLFTYFVTHANEITRLTFLWRNIPWGNIFEVCVCVCVCLSLSLSLSLGRSPLDECQPYAETSIWQHKTLTRDRHPWPRRGFEHAISASERPQTHALDRAAPGIGN